MKENVSRETIAKEVKTMGKHKIKPMKVVLRKRTYHKNLTRQEEVFCELVAGCEMSLKEAYRKAGYGSDTNGTNLLKRPHIMRRVQELREKYLAPFILSSEERKKLLTDIATNTKTANKDRIRAIDTLNKMAGEYVNKTELTGKDGGALTFSWEK